MKIHNGLPLLLACLERWETVPNEAEFHALYATPMSSIAGSFFEGFYPELLDLDWEEYREEALKLNPAHEEARVLGHLKDVESLFDLKLEGDIVLCGAFCAMDGFARFDRGRHRVFLGVDESHGRGKYLDILITHELTHVVRETRPEVWTGWGLDPQMSRKVFLNSVTAVEHLMNEGFSCAVSEILVPHQAPGSYAYQSQESLQYILSHSEAVDRVIHRELKEPDGGDYGRFYAGSGYEPSMPDYAHYVWAWQWVKHLLLNSADGDPKKLVSQCSKDWIEDALQFQLGKTLRSGIQGIL